MFVAKNRNGPDGMIFQSFVDWSDVTIKILNRDEDVDVMQSTAEALTLLKKKYQEISAK